ncbi:RES family NAD+ phosphorylase [Pantoea agglomerans]|uniref:RES family NAD+ phosphorylase n=1 Tax=Enterobacter agglomerans TaxID=549 RepID=UPI001049373A|nr:RES family NAD+ phosphorylase [Pantoea agglomerans]TCZ23282.1 RES domain-containing protein [Pantoea agglomerans]
MPLCCTDCFHDKEIAIFIGNSIQTGRCGYCKKNNAFVIEPVNLSQFFEPFIGLVKEDEDGLELSEILDNLFFIFNESIRNKGVLLCEILGQAITSKKYNLTIEFNSHIDAWEKFKEELKYENRFFPKNSIYSSLFDIRENHVDGDLFQIIEQLKVEYDTSDVFYRARLSDAELKKDKMGMPPKGYASAGRANPVGISYLYLAENEETCVAEVRPNSTSSINISSFTPKDKLSIVDLTEPRKRLSSCSFEESRLKTVIDIISLLETLSSELSKPVRPESSSIDYIPTQFLCEFIKSFSKCDGIAFESSFRKGKNFVFFNQEYFEIEDPVIHRILSIEHNYERKA